MPRKNEHRPKGDIHVAREERWIVIQNIRTGEAITLPQGATLDDVCDVALRKWGERS